MSKIDCLGYNALDIAEYIIKYEAEKDHTLSNLKLQKILYFLQAQFVVSHNAALFKEDIVAWDFGPVVEVVYYNYNLFGSASIFLNPSRMRNEYIAKSHREVINSLLDEIRPYSSTDLVDICHRQKPWINARMRYSKIIALEELKDYFSD